MQIVLTEVLDKEKWYYDNLLRIIEVTKKSFPLDIQEVK